MPSYLTPGVYMEEVPARTKPIEGVSTSNAAFVGLAPGGPLNKAVQISSWSKFQEIYSDPAPEDPTKNYGPFMKGAFLAHAVDGFFRNGGKLCYVVRVGPPPSDSNGSGSAGQVEGGQETPAIAAGKPAGKKEDAGDGSSGTEVVAISSEERAATAMIPARKERPGKDARRWTATAKGESDWVKLDIVDEPMARGSNGNGAKPESQPETFTIAVTIGRESTEYTAQTVEDLMKFDADLLALTPPDFGTQDPQAPVAGTYYLSVSNIQPSDVTAPILKGDLTARTGLDGLAAIDDVSIVCVPDIMSIAPDEPEVLQDLVVTHCSDMNNRMAILDPKPDLNAQDVLDWRLDLPFDSKQTALYYPWLEVVDPIDNKKILVPPCGHVAGVWARTDASRGVHKAPANEGVLGITGLASDVTSAEQGNLNFNGVNCIRKFRGRGIRVWGARTLSSDPEWRYINVRRLFNFISESILQGTQWAVFEPNDDRLWIRLKIAVANFLMIQWRGGALFGGTPDKAFWVQCDGETNPPELVDAGQVTTRIAIAPVKPAEFVVFQIAQYSAGENPTG